MLMLVVVFIDGAHQLFGTEVDGYDGQIVEGSFIGLTPEDM